MNTGGESAELLMKMMLNSSEVLIRLTGSGAKNVAVLLYSVLREQNKTKGSERLSNMLRSGKKLRVYTFQDKDLQKFKEVAKQYGILYTVLKDKDHTGGVFDVLVRAEDEHKLARVIERFEFTHVDTASLRAEILKEKEDREAAQKKEPAEKKEEPQEKAPEEKEKATEGEKYDHGKIDVPGFGIEILDIADYPDLNLDEIPRLDEYYAGIYAYDEDETEELLNFLKNLLESEEHEKKTNEAVDGGTDGGSAH